MLNEMGLKMWRRDMARMVMAHRIGLQDRVDPRLKLRLHRVFEEEMSADQRDSMSSESHRLKSMSTEDLAEAGEA